RWASTASAPAAGRAGYTFVGAGGWLKDDSEIPDLLPRSRAQPEARPASAKGGSASPGAAVPARAPPVRAPELDLDAPADDDDLEFDLTRERGSEQPWDSPLHEPVQAELGQSEAPVASVAAGAAMTRPTSAAHPTSLAPKATSVAPPGAVLDLGLESSAWDLDDELGDPRAAQLNVAVPLPAKDDGPWPTARTPLP